MKEELIRAIRDGAYQKPGLLVRALYRIKPDLWNAMSVELEELREANLPSDVQDDGHYTKWAGPVGVVQQYALMGPDGYRGGSVRTTPARIQEPVKYPAVAGFFNWIAPYVTSFRLNVLGPRSSLSWHRERILTPQPSGKCRVRVRFHLPVVTNPQSKVLLNGKGYQLESGVVYYFNNGAVHGASNLSNDVRIHLVWDGPLTHAVYDRMFAGKYMPSWLEKVTEPRVHSSSKEGYPHDFPSEDQLVPYDKAEVEYAD